MNVSFESQYRRGEDSQDRVYLAIKRLIITGQLGMGSRILPNPLADHLSVSITPVREALKHLTIDEIVENRPNAGFYTRRLVAQDIECIYWMNAGLLDKIVDRFIAEGRTLDQLSPPRSFDVQTSLTPTMAADLMRDLFVAVVQYFDLPQALQRTGNNVDRVYFIFMKECELFPETISELIELSKTFYRGDIAALRPALAHFHDGRIAAVPEVLRLITAAWPDAEQVLHLRKPMPPRSSHKL